MDEYMGIMVKFYVGMKKMFKGHRIGESMIRNLSMGCSKRRNPYAK